MELFWQFAGALAILVPFVLLQFGVTTVRAWNYLVPNFLGAAVLTVLAVVEQQWGFVLLQGVWALAAAYGMVRRSTGKRRIDESRA